MAQDWMPVELHTPHKPRLLAVAVRLGMDRHAVLGRFIELWTWAQRQTTNGRLPGVTYEALDMMLEKPGFCEAAAAEGWLGKDGKGVFVPHFKEHNGQSAKKRAANARTQFIKRANGNRPHRKCIPAAVKKLVLERDGPHCRYCGYDTSQEGAPVGFTVGIHLTYDHVIPVALGGDNSTNNIVVACSICNGQKTDKTPEMAGMELRSRKGHRPVTTISDGRVTFQQPIPDQTRPDQTGQVNPGLARPAGARGDSVGGSVGPEADVRAALVRVGVSPGTRNRLLAAGVTAEQVRSVVESVHGDASVRRRGPVVAFRLCELMGIEPPQKRGPDHIAGVLTRDQTEGFRRLRETRR